MPRRGESLVGFRACTGVRGVQNGQRCSGTRYGGGARGVFHHSLKLFVDRRLDLLAGHLAVVVDAEPAPARMAGVAV